MTQRELIEEVIKAYNMSRIADPKFLTHMQTNINEFSAPICAYFTKADGGDVITNLSSKLFADFSAGSHALELDRIYTRLALSDNDIRDLINILVRSVSVYSKEPEESLKSATAFFEANNWIILYRLEELVIDTSKR